MVQSIDFDAAVGGRFKVTGKCIPPRLITRPKLDINLSNGI